MTGMYVLFKLSPSVLFSLCYFTFLVYIMKFIDKMVLQTTANLHTYCKPSYISSETRNNDMHKSICRATPGDSTVQ